MKLIQNSIKLFLYRANCWCCLNPSTCSLIISYLVNSSLLINYHLPVSTSSSILAWHFSFKKYALVLNTANPPVLSAESISSKISTPQCPVYRTPAHTITSYLLWYFSGNSEGFPRNTLHVIKNKLKLIA